MEKKDLNIQFYCLLFSVVFISSCKSPSQPIIVENNVIEPLMTTSTQPIAEYIRNIIQDKKGNLWFGTNGYGIGFK